MQGVTLWVQEWPRHLKRKEANLAFGTAQLSQQRYRWVFKSGWATSNVVGIICPPGCIGLTQLPNSAWAKAHPTHLVAASLVRDVGTWGGEGQLAPQFLADQLTLFQPRGADSAHPLLLVPQFFSPSSIDVYLYNKVRQKKGWGMIYDDNDEFMESSFYVVDWYFCKKNHLTALTQEQLYHT